MKKVFLNTVLSVCMLSSFGAWAQESRPSSNNMPKMEIGKNLFTQRLELVKKYGTNNALSMGWYTGGVNSVEIRDLWNNYMLLGNYLSEKINKLVVLETDKSDREIAIDAYKGMDIVYTSAVMGSQLVKAGWKPVVGRSEDIQAVILTQNNTVINKPEDIKNIKIVGTLGTTVTYFAEYSLIKDGIYNLNDLKNSKAANFKILNTKQNQLLELLKNKQTDGVIVRETIANKLIKDNPGKYKIVYKAVSAPGHIIYVNSNVSDDTIAHMRDAFLALTPDVPTYKAILSGLDGYQETDKTPFKVVNSSSLKDSAEVFKTLGESTFVDKQ